MEQRSVQKGKGKSDGGLRTSHKPPRKIEVGYLEVEVQTEPDAVTRTIYNSGTPVFGTYDERTGIIVLDTTTPMRIQQESLLHEILHAIFKQTGLQFEEDKEEAVVRSLSPFLLMLLRNNPKLISWICG